MANPAPDSDPRWADVGGDIVEPSSGKKDKGWVGGERPAAQYFNWWMNLVYQWLLVVGDVYRGARTWWTENWKFATADMATFGWAASGGFAATIEDPAASAVISGVTVDMIPNRFLKIAGGTADNGTVVSNYIHRFTDASDVDVEFNITPLGYGTATDYSIEVGLQFSGAHRIVVQKSNSSAHWYLQVLTAGGSATDSGITATAGQTYRVRLHYVGNSGSDSTAELWIDGALVATITDSEVPKNDKARFYAKVTVTAPSAAIDGVYVQPVSLRAA